MKTHILTVDFCLNKYTESRLQIDTLGGDARENYHPKMCVKVIITFFL